MVKDLVNLWTQKEKAYNFEGDAGLQKLENLLGVLNYKEQPFKYGDPIQRFLSDNPGAIEALIEWLSKEVPKNEEWSSALSEELGVEDTDEETRDEMSEYDAQNDFEELTKVSSSCDTGHHNRCVDCACSCHR